ncbi:MAG TPA: GGDEF domain-containing protein [Xanthomonadaceae bacterium]|nr:GGDEF domain-containing protein [Xanthomonadaceae bacterium]
MIRRLVLYGTLVYLLLGVGELLLLGDRSGLSLTIRVAVAPLLLMIWWGLGVAQRIDTQALLVCLVLLLVSSGQSLTIAADPASAERALAGFVLIVILSGPLWLNSRHFLWGAIACLAPPLFTLFWIDAGVDVWVPYGTFSVAALLTAFVLWRERMRAAQRSMALRSELERRAVSDALTGVLNRAGWDRSAPDALRLSAIRNVPASLIYFDLDHFKSVNDEHGHAVGDAVIERVADLIREQVRQGDLVARLGGEEFVALLPGAGLDAALRVAERVRRACASSSDRVSRTISAGVAQWHIDETLKELMARADAAMLRAKQFGRNRVEVCAFEVRG